MAHGSLSKTVKFMVLTPEILWGLRDSEATANTLRIRGREFCTCVIGACATGLS